MTSSIEVRTEGTAGSLACWYADPEHRPRIGRCPTTCSGPSTHAERVGAGELRTYCETHAAWRRASVRLPTMVWRLA